MSTRRIPVWASLFTVAGVSILCGLGTWQLQRADWKRDLIAQLDKTYAADPIPATTASITTEAARTHDSLFYSRVTITGRYNATSFAVGPRTQEGHNGYHIIAPLQLDDGGFVLVNRGWAADSAVPAPTNRVTVTGLLRRPETPNMFVPPNNVANNQWYSIDIPAMTTAAQTTSAAPLVLYAASEDPADSTIAYHTARPALPDNHRNYAFFWFSMAGIMIVIYALRFLRRG
ncbi:MAG: SURF1 family protein [Alphaproteobacteria bacterium]|nr:SURF1 family protein [Alphaproteobacteria bacterium]